jgi:hypothetical protein
MPVGLGPLTHYAAGSLPTAPVRVAVPHVAAWGMLGNDRYGDCGVAGLDHLMMAVAADHAESETFPVESEVVDYYTTYTHGQDDGVVLSEFLAYTRARGFLGHTVAGYAPVAVHDVPTLRFVVASYGAAYCGIEVTEGMQEAFADQRPWTATSLRSQSLGGHCVPVVAYDDTYLYAVTWGQIQAITWPAWHEMASEAWAIITSELAAANGHGVDLAALTADLDRLDG